MINNPQIKFGLRLSQDEKDLMTDIAQKENRSINTTIRLAINAYKEIY